MPKRMARYQLGLDTGKEFLAVLDEYKSIAVRQQVSAGAFDERLHICMYAGSFIESFASSVQKSIWLQASGRARHKV